MRKTIAVPNQALGLWDYSKIESQSRFETLRFANRKACDVDTILLCSRAYAWLPALSGSLTNQKSERTSVLHDQHCSTA